MHLGHTLHMSYVHLPGSMSTGGVSCSFVSDGRDESSFAGAAFCSTSRARSAGVSTPLGACTFSVSPWAVTRTPIPDAGAFGAYRSSSSFQFLHFIVICRELIHTPCTLLDVCMAFLWHQPACGDMLGFPPTVGLQGVRGVVASTLLYFFFPLPFFPTLGIGNTPCTPCNDSPQPHPFAVIFASFQAEIVPPITGVNPLLKGFPKTYLEASGSLSQRKL